MSKPPPDSAVLQETNDRWLDRLFRTEAPRLARFIRRAVRNQDEVHDLVQETFVKLVASPPPARPHTPDAYLRQIAKGILWCRAHRAPLRAKAIHVPIDEAPDLATAPEQALSELPALTREVFRLSRQQDLTYSQISKEMGITVRAVELQMKKALRYPDHRVSTDD